MYNHLTKERIIYLILWIMVFTFPVLLSTGGNRIDWVRVAHEELRIFPFFLVFLINNLWLFRIFRNKKYVFYFLSAGTVVLIFSALSSYQGHLYQLLRIPSPPAVQGKKDLLWLLNSLFYNTVFSILVIGLNNAVKIAFDWFREKKNLEELQKETLKNRLELLQHQVSPHFLMNTLNNIHALIDYDPDVAKNSVVRLSKLMRALLYDTDHYTLEKEVQFISDYLELMKIRVSESVDIRYTTPETIPLVCIPPLLFITYVENAFKHGILATGRSFIHIELKVENKDLIFSVINSKSNERSPRGERSTIGLENARNRLDLVYGRNHTLNVTETLSTYQVYVKIPLYDDQMPGH